MARNCAKSSARIGANASSTLASAEAMLAVTTAVKASSCRLPRSWESSACCAAISRDSSAVVLAAGAAGRALAARLASTAPYPLVASHDRPLAALASTSCPMTARCSSSVP